MFHPLLAKCLASAALAASFLTLAPVVRAQVTWTQRFPATSPGPRCCTGMAYDASRARSLIFGGFAPGVGFTAETWQWDGSDWLQRTPALSPPARDTHALAYDSTRRRIVLFAGGTDGQMFNDTWEWDGGNWIHPELAVSPTGRSGPAMAYDAGRGTMVLFGGIGSGLRPLGDTWEYDGVQWTRRLPMTVPPARSLHGLVYDPRRARIVMFGGGDPFQGVYLDDTWEWDGTDWTEITTTQAPPRRLRHGMVWDAARDRIVLLGGHDAVGSLADTWERSGSVWILRSPGTVPPARRTHGMAFDTNRERVVVFGGQRVAGFTGETWEYSTSAPASYTPFGVGCPRSAGVPALRTVQGSRPWIAEPFRLEVTPIPDSNAAIGLIGVSSVAWGTLTLPLDLGVIGAPGCSIYTSVELSLQLIGAAGVAPWTLPIPNLATLVGQSLFMQAIVIDPAVQAGFVVSDAGQAILGAK